MVTPPHPPRLAEWLLSVLIPDHRRESVLGDLAEEFVDVCASETEARARAWYWKQAWLSLPHLTVWRMRGSRMIAALMALLVSYLVLSASLAIFFLLFRQAYSLNLFQGAVMLALGVRLALECAAIFVGGAVLGHVVASSGWRDAGFMGQLTLVLAGFVFLPDLWAFGSTSHDTARLYLGARLMMGLPMLAAGAWISRSLVRPG